MTDAWLESVRSLLDAPSPAVLATYRRDGTAVVTPVWFRWNDGAFEVVIAEGDVKLRHLAANPECILVVFEAEPGVLLRLVAREPRVWDLAPILPS
jgi:nitroimidazol reductase NimA-like FMN-containing flavoprotein (pyridoxamine 5'-phosphate oxidase superfamily)